MSTTFDPTKPHCSAEARFVSDDGKDGGGHVTCLTELLPDGTCPKADVHHMAWIDSGLSQDDWAATVVAARAAKIAPWGVIEGPIGLDGRSTMKEA